MRFRRLAWFVFFLGNLGWSQSITPSACRRPADLEAVLRTRPSAPAYNALGKYFGDRNQVACAVAAFESAIRSDPKAWEGRYNLGLTLLNSNRPKRAAAEFEAVVGARPDWPDSHNAYGSALQSEGLSAEAARQFEAALRLEPGNGFALEHLTAILIDQGRYTAAITALTPAPADPGLRTNLAVALSKNGRTSEAIEILTELAANQPDSAAAHFNLATELANQKRYRECIGEYRQALRLDPANSVARTSLVKAYNILAEYAEALPLIEEYARQPNGDVEAPYLLGEVYRGLGRYSDAIVPLTKAVRLRPDHYESLYNLGFVLAKADRNQSALPNLEKAVKLRPHGVDARYQLAMVLKALNQPERSRREFAAFNEEKRLQASKDVAAVDGGRANQYLNSGDAEQAVKAYRDSLASDPDNARTYYNLALALDRQGDGPAEREALEQAVRIDPKLSPALNQLGLLYLQGGKLAEAEARLKQALEIDPQYAEAQSNLGVLYGQQGDTQRAEELFRHATENSPAYAQAFLNLGLILAGQSKFPEAASQIEKAIALNPHLNGGLSALGMVNARMGRSRDAIDAFRRVLVEEPSSPESHLNLGIALADSYDVEGALKEFAKAVELAPGSPVLRYNKGRALFDLRRYPDAKAELEQVWRIAPDYFEALYLLALTEKQLGDREGSVELLQKAIALRPGDADAHFLLGQDFAQIGRPLEAIAQWKTAVEINPRHTQALSNLIRSLNDSDPGLATSYRKRFDDLQANRMITDQAGTLSNFALASADAHDWDQAVSQLKEAIQVCADCSSRGSLHKNLGLIYCRSGNLTDGEEQLRVAGKFLPGDAEIRRSLDLIASVRKPPPPSGSGASR